MSRNKINRIIKEIVRKIVRYYKPNKIVLFGSYANGKPDRDSDIDMLIVKSTSKRIVDRFVETKRIAYEKNRKISFDPLVFTPSELKERVHSGDDFIIEILNKGKILYAK